MDSKPDSRAASAARSAASLEAEFNPRSLRQEPAAEQALMVPPADEGPPALDDHGFDPAAYRWVPVLRKPRADGWTPQRQVEFIATLADTGCVAQAARAAGMSARSCYRLRRAPGAENFAAA